MLGQYSTVLYHGGFSLCAISTVFTPYPITVAFRSLRRSQQRARLRAPITRSAPPYFFRIDLNRRQTRTEQYSSMLT